MKMTLIIDEASKQKRAYVNVLAQLFCPEYPERPTSALINSHYVGKDKVCGGEAITKIAQDSLTSLGLTSLSFAALMSDNVAYMKLAGRMLRETFAPQLLLIYCPCHILHLVAKSVVMQKKETLLPLVYEILTYARAYTLMKGVKMQNTLPEVPDWAETRPAPLPPVVNV
jgi:hypothetical protein